MCNELSKCSLEKEINWFKAGSSVYFRFINNTWQKSQAELNITLPEMLLAIDIPDGALITGGVSNFKGISDAFVLRKDKIRKINSMKYPRAAHSMVLLDSQVFVVGGTDYVSQTWEKCEMYDLVKETWTILSSMNEQRSHCGIGVLNRQIYVAGGENSYSGYLNSIERYDCDLNEWKLISVKLKKKLLYPVCCGKDGKLLILGGFGQEGNNNEVERYNPISNVMERVKDLTVGVWSLMAPIVENSRITLFARGDEENPPSTVVYAFN